MEDASSETIILIDILCYIMPLPTPSHCGGRQHETAGHDSSSCNIYNERKAAFLHSDKFSSKCIALVLPRQARALQLADWVSVLSPGRTVPRITHQRLETRGKYHDDIKYEAS